MRARDSWCLRLVVITRLHLDSLVDGSILSPSHLSLSLLSKVLVFVLLCANFLLDGRTILTRSLSSTIPARAALFCYLAPSRDTQFIESMDYHRTVNLRAEILPSLAQNPRHVRLAPPACSLVSILSIITDLNAKFWGTFLFWPYVRTARKLADFDICSAAAGKRERKNLTHHKRLLIKPL